MDNNAAPPGLEKIAAKQHNVATVAQIISAPPLPEVGHRESQKKEKDGKIEPTHHIPGIMICPSTSWTFDQSGRQAPTRKIQNRNIEQKK